MKEKDRQKKKIITYLILAGITVVVLLAFVFGVFGNAAEDESEESMQAIKNAVMEKSLQCYCIEGAYPSELSYLEENYGLVVNKTDYYIVYRSVGENLPPQVTVALKNGQKDNK